MRARVQSLSEEVLRLRKEENEHTALNREVEANRVLHRDLVQRYENAKKAGGIESSSVFIVDRAALAGAPSEPNVVRSVIIGLALGLGLGAIFAIALEMPNGRIRVSASHPRRPRVQQPSKRRLAAATAIGERWQVEAFRQR